jgi:hypothetical protein
LHLRVKSRSALGNRGLLRLMRQEKMTELKKGRRAAFRPRRWRIGVKLIFASGAANAC